jgi:hypothetical protein
VVSSSNQSMLKQALLTTLAVFLAGASQGRPGPGHNQSKPDAQVTDARASQSVGIQITISSGENELLVPYCGDGEGDIESLCNLTIQIQVEGPNGWTRIKPKYPNVVLGGVPPEKWRSQLIPGGQSHAFAFAFSKDDFVVQRGQRLRVIVDAWRDEQSMRAQKQAIQLTSGSFKCP